ncbi:hypothetical protein MKK70_11090 [Methylobacterium sp. E-041]|uniref:NACHT domain-containing protein n=1 Tax=Methylobacterium sp. E-041 TaxID=2836573 RepID=UPI001FBB8B1D|nr:hypothetical protein [Methylobacterium sp. E-041]MCJ2105910.1 hypothetical protein [Methylobacterium sp. E-041]
MSNTHDLAKLDERSFEHMINFLAMKVLGPGVTTFGPGSDGGRDGYYQGTAPYPSTSDTWSGIWYIQSKFHRPHLTKDSQAWVLEQISDELKEFAKPGTNRVWPNIWIFATNVDISAVPDNGTFDKARKLVRETNPALEGRFHIWSGNKIIGLLNIHNEVTKQYLHLLTPGHVLASIFDGLQDERASVEELTRYLIVNQFDDQQYTKLEQAGSSTDIRPGIQRLFIDLPYICTTTPVAGKAAQSIAHSLARNHQIDARIDKSDNWQSWSRNPQRSRIWFIKAGPGQGKSTIGQYLSQIQRAAFITHENGPRVNFQQMNTAREVKEIAVSQNLWPASPRIPVYVELKDFAQWVSRQKNLDSTGILVYLSSLFSAKINKLMLPGTFKRALSAGKWLFIFDGLDEVPSNFKDKVAQEVTLFIDNLLIEVDSDAMSICTSRPQGYSGQFSDLHSAVVILSDLSAEQALACARPILEIGRTQDEAERNIEILKEALSSQAITEIMKTPLQSHIMAVVVRDGGRPPERRWQLYDNFYRVVKKREANKASPNHGLAILLRDGDKLIKALHNKLGFELHKSAELGEGSDTSLSKTELQAIVYNVTSSKLDDGIAETSAILMEATTDRLVLVNTPETTEKVRFDVRQLQEFFAGEYIYEGVEHELLHKRLSVIASDQHWREVMHFVLSAIVENRQQTNLAVAVSVLNSIDSSDDPDVRIYRRRLAIGGLIAARLLSEGVLEQDKRDRQQFRTCFSTLLASADHTQLNSLIHVRGTQSRVWLREVAADHLFDQSPSETLGAAYICLLTMPDDYKRLPQVAQYLSATTKCYKVALLSMLPAQRSLTIPDLPQWSIRFILNFLSSTDCSDISETLASNLISILDAQPTKIPVMSDYFGIDVRHISLITPFFSDVPRRDFRELSVFDQEHIGPLVVHRHNAPPDLCTENWSEEMWLIVRQLPGILSILSFCLDCFIADNNEKLSDALEKLVRSLDKHPIPDQWQILLPPEFTFCNSNYALGLKLWRSARKQADRIPSLVSTLSLSGHEPIDIHQLEYLQNRFPMILFDYLMDFKKIPHPGIEELLQSSDGASSVLRTFQNNPELVQYVPHRWGQFINLNLTTSPGFRKIIATQQSVPYRDASIREIYAFPIDVQSERHLLPSIVKVIVQSMWHVEYDVFEVEESSFARRATVRALVGEYVQDSSQLLDVVLDSTVSNETRSAAAMLYLMHPEEKKPLLYDCLAVMIDNYDSHTDWYLIAASSALIENIPRDSVSLKAIGRLLNLGRTDFLGRIEMNKALGVWRERSTEPVSHGISGMF